MAKAHPEGWAPTTFGELIQPSRERMTPADAPPTLPYVGLEHVESHTLRLLSHGCARDVRSTSMQFSTGDVLYSKLRPYLNKIWVATFAGLCSAEFLVFPSCDWLSNWFLAFRMSADDFVSFAGARTRGERPRVSFANLSPFPILLPPREEQERIVKRITAILERSERAKLAVRRAADRLPDYRAAVLHAAVQGQLSNSWRQALDEGRATHGKHPTKPVFDLASDMSPRNAQPNPEGWTFTTVEKAGKVTPGLKRTPQRHSGPHMRPYLRVANVLEDRIDISDLNTMNFSPREFDVYSLREGDILLNEGQSPDLVGRPAMFHGELPACGFQNTLLRFRAYDVVDPRFALRQR